MSGNLTRKEFLARSAKYAAGVAAGTVGLDMMMKEKSFAGTGAATWPWPYQALDVESVRILGHDSYYATPVGGCCYGSFNAIIQALRTAVGDPYNSLPTEMMYFGAGGGAGWGTLCGALNGAAAAISLVSAKADISTLVGELLGWYTQTDFPTDASNDLATQSKYTVNKDTTALPQNKAGSPLCHISVTEWCKSAQLTASDAKRLERCARLTGDVAAYAVKILNDKLAGTFTPLYVAPTDIATCKGCHSASGTPMNIVASNMDCVQCHGDHNAQSVNQISGLPDGFQLSHNYPNPFNPTTHFDFAVPRRENVTISIYDVHGRPVRTLIDNAPFAPGNYRADWNGTNNRGEKVASGTYFLRIVAGSFRKSVKMSLLK